MTPWRNGSASDSRPEGCVFKSRRGHSPCLPSIEESSFDVGDDRFCLVGSTLRRWRVREDRN
ncbi:hypothetical protein BZA05DRAFT_387959 [Tricharina praecox]|uniref:uncharacterized protein n=1 Tax=Tricharina praecox TaxID=43433 RepID=UPI0022210040|nr:uncharacterized protein BZA05DRAFT_387959 [Tricharina praecox]KAI5856272.1 hypothetical protein BZA05DRAFT_387959 [Tricharina praecox]